MLRKGISEGFKDIDVKEGIVSGYLAHFGSKDSDGDIIVKGAFQKSINDRGPQSAKPRIKFLLDHDKKKVVGVFKELKEDDYGLYYEAKAGRHAAGRDFLLMVEDGIITEHSHGFVPVKEQQKSDANYIYESYLFEGSALQFLGANENTPVTGIKEFDTEQLAGHMERLEKAIRNGRYTDDAFPALIKRLETIQELLKSLTGAEPGSATQQSEPSKPEGFSLISFGKIK